VIQNGPTSSEVTSVTVGGYENIRSDSNFICQAPGLPHMLADVVSAALRKFAGCACALQLLLVSLLVKGGGERALERTDQFFYKQCLFARLPIFCLVFVCRKYFVSYP